MRRLDSRPSGSGFGSAVLETLSDAGVTPRIMRVGLPDRFVTPGTPALLHEEVGFPAERIWIRFGRLGDAVGCGRDAADHARRSARPVRDARHAGAPA